MIKPNFSLSFSLLNLQERCLAECFFASQRNDYTQNPYTYVGIKEKINQLAHRSKCFINFPYIQNFAESQNPPLSSHAE